MAGFTAAAEIDGLVYILEFEQPVAIQLKNGRPVEVRYYIGWAQNEHTFTRRIKHHKNGSGARLTARAAELGIGFKVVVIVPNATRHDERRWKNWKNTKKVVRALLNKGYHANL